MVLIFLLTTGKIHKVTIAFLLRTKQPPPQVMVLIFLFTTQEKILPATIAIAVGIVVVVLLLKDIPPTKQWVLIPNNIRPKLLLHNTMTSRVSI